jgi:hypothetical protein
MPCQTSQCPCHEHGSRHVTSPKTLGKCLKTSYSVCPRFERARLLERITQRTHGKATALRGFLHMPSTADLRTRYCQSPYCTPSILAYAIHCKTPKQVLPKLLLHSQHSRICHPLQTSEPGIAEAQQEGDDRFGRAGLDVCVLQYMENTQ